MTAKKQRANLLTPGPPFSVGNLKIALGYCNSDVDANTLKKRKICTKRVSQLLHDYFCYYIHCNYYCYYYYFLNIIIVNINILFSFLLFLTAS